MSTTFQKCSECKELGFIGQHKCKPEWLAADAEDGPWDPREAAPVRADDAQSAAEAYAERCDSEGDVIRAGGIDVVLVASSDSPDAVTRWRVNAEARVDYSAEELSEESGGAT